MFNRREHEPEYALLTGKATHEKNRYGKDVELAPEGSPLREEPFIVNGDEPGPNMLNPNRYKQHGFHFNADNCIACHACETACAEKNRTPAHIAFRSVGIVECGAYPNTRRLNISMACNHCDDPVCLKGCPTRAYTKFAEYGAVLQDPDICFGCGYCTWVCPYNAPQLDPVAGHVSKCNMCVDRLEVGLKPACVAACLGNALDFGVIEEIPEGRVEAKTSIPGFPDPDITRPNIRFQQMKTLEREVSRLDSMPVRYEMDDGRERYVPALDPKYAGRREWNLKKLLTSHEMAHVAFTLSAQAVMAAFLLLVPGAWLGIAPLKAFSASGAFVPTLWIMVALLTFGLFKLNMHLGRPHRFYRGFYNLRMSPVSREIAGVSAFSAGLAGYAFLAPFDGGFATVLRVIAALVALAGLAFGGWYMYRLYRIKARPFWDHWHTAASFSGSGLALGAMLIALCAAAFDTLHPALVRPLAGLAAFGIALEAAGLAALGRDIAGARNEGAASWHILNTLYGRTFLLRAGLMAAAFILSAGLAAGVPGGVPAFLALAALVLAEAVIGRALFFACVIPTTMPGAYFWRNPGFVEHAREIGLARMPQVGVAYEGHHRFRLDELMATIRETTWEEKWDQLKRIFTG